MQIKETINLKKRGNKESQEKVRLLVIDFLNKKNGYAAASLFVIWHHS